MATYEEETDNGTMPSNVDDLANLVVGHKIVKVEKLEKSISYMGKYGWEKYLSGLALTLDNGKTVYIEDTDDCCAYTALQTFLFNADKIDHIITGVHAEDNYTTWHVVADMGDVLELTVGWSAGNPFYYGYGFDFVVIDPDGKLSEQGKDA